MERRGSPMQAARQSFEFFVSRFDTSDVSTVDEEHLQTYLVYWLEEGNGVEYTGRNYETYLRAVVEIADAALQGELDMDYIGSADVGRTDARVRRLKGIHHPDGSESAFLDRATYEIAAYRHENRQRGMLNEELPQPPHEEYETPPQSHLRG